MPVSKISSPKELPFQFSLHLRHPSIDPAEVSRELQLSALESFRAGAPRASRSGIAATALHGETYWAAIIDPLTWSLSALVPASLRGSRRRDLNPDELPPDHDVRLHDARVLRMRFGAAGGATEGPFSLGWALWLTCACLHTRHGEFLRRLSTQGGSLTLLVAYSEEALSGLRLLPDTARQAGELGLTIKFELTETESLS